MQVPGSFAAIVQWLVRSSPRIGPDPFADAASKDRYQDMNQPSPSDPSENIPHSQEVRHSQVGALVPAHVARGVFTTGAVVLQGQHEFIVDFLLRMQQPQQVAARLVLPAPVVAQLIAALQDNIQKYEQRYGNIHMPAVPQNSDQPRPSAEEIYDTLKLAEDVQSGAYANAVMIGHSASEFSLDFITTFFPRSAVSARVFMAAPNARRLLDSLKHSFSQFQQRQQQSTAGNTPSAASPDAPPDDGPADFPADGPAPDSPKTP